MPTLQHQGPAWPIAVQRSGVNDNSLPEDVQVKPTLRFHMSTAFSTSLHIYSDLNMHAYACRIWHEMYYEVRH